jgi:hypothetical protein
LATAAIGLGRTRFREEAIWIVPVSLMAAGLFALACILGSFHGASPWAMLSGHAHKALRMVPPLLCAAVLVQAVRAIRTAPGAPFDAFMAFNRGLFADRWLAAARLVPLLLMPIVFVGFGTLKMLMPRVVPFWLDDHLAAIDRLLFLGHQPWQLTHALLGSAGATIVIGRFYFLWVLILSLAIGLFALCAPRRERARFFLSFTAAWVVLGVAGAWIASSAGPCYAAQVGASSAPEFAGLVARLEAVSMHNAIAMLYVLAGFRVSRRLGWLMTGYATVVFVGSIHLGWHYASDGIVAAAAMWAIWRGADAWCRRSGYDAAVAATETRAIEARFS